MNIPYSRTALLRSFKLAVAALLGVSAALLVACGTSGTGLIPAASAGPLQSDFEAVAQAAKSGNGNCLATESALGKTQQDFLALPSTVDAGLRGRLREGIANLRKVALAMCAQPAAGAASTATTPTTTTSTTSTSTTTPTTTTPTTGAGTTTTPTTTTPPANNGGGTPAPEESEEGPGKGKGKGEAEGKGEGNGDGGAGGASPEGGH
ncbi:MAG TPA: hypothetical protein VHS55_05345 [Solirubrobacteraceae bacterium]|jgi:cytoskeletal protein RodZ|nr:hypothetical protein [Solirubrobacteraceae bacterium]